MRIPIRVHITLIIMLAIIAFFNGLPGVLLAAGFFTCVAVHELGHSWVAIRKGCRVHEILLLPIGGVAKMTGMASDSRSELLIALAGPLTSFILFVPLYFLAPYGWLFAALAGVNLMLCLFNLLPSFPMDGGRIFRAFMTPRLGLLKATALAARIGRNMAVLFGVIGFINMIAPGILPGILGNIGGFFLILIAIFIYQAAGAEYRAVAVQYAQQQWFTVDQSNIDVSPPPYARKKEEPLWKTWTSKTNAFFNDLFKNWKE